MKTKPRRERQPFEQPVRCACDMRCPFCEATTNSVIWYASTDEVLCASCNAQLPRDKPEQWRLTLKVEDRSYFPMPLLPDPAA